MMSWKATQHSAKVQGGFGDYEIDFAVGCKCTAGIVKEKESAACGRMLLRIHKPFNIIKL